MSGYYDGVPDGFHVVEDADGERLVPDVCGAPLADGGVCTLAPHEPSAHPHGHLRKTLDQPMATNLARRVRIRQALRLLEAELVT